MRPLCLLLPGFLLLASATISLAQTAPAFPAAPAATVAPTVPAEETPNRFQVKVGLNVGRAFRNGGPFGGSSRIPLTVGAEYWLNSKFTLYSQLDTDFDLFSRRHNLTGERGALVPSSALGVGVRYYYNQARRGLGRFQGNYVAAEMHTELRHQRGQFIETIPALNLLWGTQRRLSPSFLVDFNAGLGVGLNDQRFGYHPGTFTATTQLNLGIYFGR